MHSEPPLDNHDPQCRLQMATSPCWWPIVTGGSRNPPSAKSLPRRQFNQRLRQENRTEDNGDGSQVEGGCKHWHTTCAHHFARAIYLLHLLPPFFVHMWWQRTCSLAGLAWDVSAASRKRTVVLCMNKTLFSIVQSCVSVCSGSGGSQLKNQFCHPHGQHLQSDTHKNLQQVFHITVDKCWLPLLCTSDGFGA